MLAVVSGQRSWWSSWVTLGRVHGTLLLVALTSCVEVRELPGPPVPPGGSMLLGLLERTGVRIAAAQADLHGALVVPAFSRGQGVEVYAFVYPCALGDLGLGEGWQPAEVRPPPGEVLFRWDDASPGGPWVPEASRPPALERPPSSVCASFSQTSWIMEGTEGGPLPRFAIALDPHRALVGAFLYLAEPRFGGERELFWQIELGREPRLVDLPGQPGHAAAYRANDGRIILLDDDGAVSEGDLERGFTVTSTLATPRRARLELAWMDGTHGDGPLELFVVTDWGTLEHYDGTRWETLDELGGCAPGEKTESCDHGYVEWLGPREAVAVRPGHPGYVTHVKDGRVSYEAFDPTETLVATTTAYSSRLGVIVATSRGSMFATRDWRSWDQIQAAQLSGIGAVAPFGDGLVVAGNGSVSQFQPPADCVDHAVPVGSDLGPLVALEGAFFDYNAVVGQAWVFHLLEVTPPSTGGCPHGE